MDNFKGLLIYEKLNKLNIEIGLTHCFVNCNSGPKRAHGVMICSFYFLWDDWLESHYVTVSDEQLKLLEKHVNQLSRMFKIAHETGQICIEECEGFELDLVKSKDFYEAQVIILRTAKATFETDRLFRKWALTVYNYLMGYFEWEIPAIRKATSENRYCTEEEYADFRFMSTGLGWLTAYQFTDDMVLECFSDLSEVQAIVSLWGGLQNEVMSIGKEATRGDLLEVENRVRRRMSIDKNVSFFEAMKETCRQADDTLEVLLNVRKLLPLRMKPFVELAMISWISMIPYYVQSSRYGWKLAD